VGRSSAKRIVELPLNGRDYNQLAALARRPVGHAAAGQRELQGVLNVNGNRTYNVFLLDSVDNISTRTRFAARTSSWCSPRRGAAGVQIQTNAYSAEYGRNQRGRQRAIKSGTNTIQGSVYEFLRDDSLDANNFFSNALGTEAEARLRSVRRGCRRPIVKNRTFWFAD
jgi:hypothetical protein